MSFDFPFVRLFGVRQFYYYPYSYALDTGDVFHGSTHIACPPGVGLEMHVLFFLVSTRLLLCSTIVMQSHASAPIVLFFHHYHTKHPESCINIRTHLYTPHFLHDNQNQYSNIRNCLKQEVL